jgi:two-component system LytT family response regulator
MIRALLVDDEPVARRGLRALLEPHRDIAVVGECRNGIEARSAFATLEPELVFLDVKMPDLDGFGALASSADMPPAVVFVTAFEEHARRAFDVDAVDYLLKPFDRSRFELALSRARTRLGAGDRTAPSRRLLVRDGRRLLGVDLDQVSHLVARGNYVRIHTTTGAHLHREPIGRLGARVKGQGFIRISRSVFVNRDHVTEVRPLANGRQLVLLKSGARLGASRRMSSGLRGELKSTHHAIPTIHPGHSP